MRRFRTAFAWILFQLFFAPDVAWYFALPLFWIGWYAADRLIDQIKSPQAVD